MDRRDKQSSLPISLIPHLYSAPQQPRDSSTRTTLPSPQELTNSPQQDQSYLSSYPLTSLIPPLQPSPAFNHRPASHTYVAYESEPLGYPDDRQLGVAMQDLSASLLHHPFEPSATTRPVYSDPVFHSSSRPSISSRTPSYTFPPPPGPREIMMPRTWREGEAGPSSLVHPGPRDAASVMGRRGSSQSARVISHSDTFGRGNTTFDQDGSFGDLVRRDAERNSYLSHIQRVYGSNTAQTSHPLPRPQYLVPSSDEEPSFSFDRQDSYTYPPVASLSISGGPTSTHQRSERSSDFPLIMYRSESHPGDFGDSEGDGGSNKGKRRRAESLDADDNARKSRNARKTAVACNFCRGRKLRCNGAKPSCSNCTVRKFDCEYVPTQRRRGPGKAPKGSRSKKMSHSSRLDPSGSNSKNVGDRPPSSVPEYELDALAPELRPYTSVLSLDTFAFQPPDPSPQYPTDANQLMLMRPQYSRARTSRSRETSSEDRSDAEDIFTYRRMSHGS
ncbi:hypothetical protein B0H34DRAFT_782730 [Crassisporium funariophilum]|nr:hypothetical protein B0H34DRAFT_782730 [Crassisporium funariophilum]